MKTSIDMIREYAQNIYFPETGKFGLQESDNMLIIEWNEEQDDNRMIEIWEELNTVYHRFQKLVSEMSLKASKMLCGEKEF